jgi:hypothetical protein
MTICLGTLFNAAANAAPNTVLLAVFDHSRLTAATQCIRCHQSNQPDDDRHRQTRENCSTCHFTDRWKPVINNATQ